MEDRIAEVVKNIHWLGHASFKITGSKTIYIDPWKLSGGHGGDADLVLVTHDHFDHCSPDDIKKALGKNGKVVAATCCKEKYPIAHHYVLPYTKLKVDNIDIYVTAAYNVNKNFHLREFGHCGYILSIDGVKIYHTGDTDAFPHMRDFTCDIVLLPVSGTYTMDPSEAVDACLMLKPKLAIPMHFGDIVGAKEHAEAFKKIAPCEVLIKEPI